MVELFKSEMVVTHLACTSKGIFQLGFVSFLIIHWHHSAIWVDADLVIRMSKKIPTRKTVYYMHPRDDEDFQKHLTKFT